MIRVKLLNRAEMIINAELIEAIEAAPDTIITLTTGRKIISSDSVDEVVNRAVAYQTTIRGISKKESLTTDH